MIRKYGYIGTDKVMKLYRECPENGDLKDLAVGTVHLIHSSSENRFTITDTPGHISKEFYEKPKT
ncbi:MAG: hypothetical protein LBC02_04075 [Planctomycetaceae bacterium]|nr:hypothetical protein [Planctomycetaceae bacterium]